MPFPPHSNNPYLRIPEANPYSPEPARCFLAHDDETVVPHHSHHADGSIIPTVWTDEDEAKPDSILDTGIDMDIILDAADGTVVRCVQRMTPETLRFLSGGTLHSASLTLPGDGIGEIRATPLPSGHRVEEVTLEVPVSHDKLAHALSSVAATIAGRRAFGYTIPEESRTVTTVGNEIVIRWEEHS